MCGSGVVLRIASELGHESVGYDVDPLAVLMSRVWTRKRNHATLPSRAGEVVINAKRRRCDYVDLPWVASCDETRSFIEYWFSEPQRTQLSRLAFALNANTFGFPDWAMEALYLSLSRIIVTKQAGASLAWDASHSRPHRKTFRNKYDVYEGFLLSAQRLEAILDRAPLECTAKVKLGDCRNLVALEDSSVNAIVTSPPYLNALDYLRGHKLALVWMGYTIPHLREVRAGAIGTERSGKLTHTFSEVPSLEDVLPPIRLLPKRQRSIVHKYAWDAGNILRELRRVVMDNGRVVLVVADSCVRGVQISNSHLFSWIAKLNGLVLAREEERDIPHNRRYLPINSASDALSARMRRETVQMYLPA